MKICRKDIKKRVIDRLSMYYYQDYFQPLAFDEYYNTLKKIVIKYYKDNEYRLSNEVLEDYIYEITKSIVDALYSDYQRYGFTYKYISIQLAKLTEIKGYLYDKVDLYYTLSEEE